MIPETCQFSRLSDRVATECISFGDKALDCGCCSEGQALVLVGILLADLRVGSLCRVAHEPTLFRSLKLLATRDFYPFPRAVEIATAKRVKKSTAALTTLSTPIAASSPDWHGHQPPLWRVCPLWVTSGRLSAGRRKDCATARRIPTADVTLVVGDEQAGRGSLAMLLVTRRASSIVSTFACRHRPASLDHKYRRGLGRSRPSRHSRLECARQSKAAESGEGIAELYRAEVAAILVRTETPNRRPPKPPRKKPRTGAYGLLWFPSPTWKFSGR